MLCSGQSWQTGSWARDVYGSLFSCDAETIRGWRICIDFLRMAEGRVQKTPAYAPRVLDIAKNVKYFVSNVTMSLFEIVPI